MYAVRFPSLRLVEFTNPMLFQVQVGKWMQEREAENSYLLGRLPWIVSAAQANRRMPERLFALQDGEQFVAAAILFDGQCFCHTWASKEMLDAIADGLVAAKCAVKTVLGPAHVSWQLAQRLARRTGQTCDLGRAERIYQVTRLARKPTGGRLELATDRDTDMLRPWMAGFVDEAHYEMQPGLTDQTLRDMVQAKTLYLWKQPEARSMAAWTAPTAHGGSINFVYTPPLFRRRGYARAVVSALAQQMLQAGVWYCFILTDTDNERTNKLYQTVGARTLCELLRCTIGPRIAEPPKREQTALIA